MQKIQTQTDPLTAPARVIPAKLPEILEAIYAGGLTESNCSEIIEKIAERIEDSFYEDPPDEDQHQLIRDLKKIAERVEKVFAWK